MINRQMRASAIILCLLISAPLASPGSKEKEKHHPPDNAAMKDNHQVAVSIFIGNDRDVIRQHYHGHYANLPPGQAKKHGDLPPGLAKQLQRSGHLPPGLEKKLVPFPVELERRLPPLKPGLKRGFIEGRAVILDSKTSLILDIFMVI
jgi:hypothetical protein